MAKPKVKYLGALCKRGHSHEGTGRSLRYSSNWRCVVCLALSAVKWKKANPEKVKAAFQKWLKANPEKAKATHQKWLKANPEKAKATHQKWLKANPEKAKAAAQKWKKKNPEKAKAAFQKWKKKNPKKAKAAHQKWLKANPEKARAVVQEWISSLSDGYVRSRLGLKKGDNAPPGLIEAKRLQLKISRLIREMKNGK